MLGWEALGLELRGFCTFCAVALSKSGFPGGGTWTVRETRGEANMCLTDFFCCAADVTLLREMQKLELAVAIALVLAVAPARGSLSL